MDLIIHLAKNSPSRTGTLLFLLLLLSPSFSLAQEIKPVPPEDLPAHGTFWSFSRTNFPPWPKYPPFLREMDAPVYLLDGKRGVFVVDDSQVDYPAIYKEREAEKALRKLEWEVGLLSDTEYWAQEGGGPPPADFDYPSNSLYLEITGVTNDEAAIIVHGTVPGESYALLSKTHLTNATWAGEQVVEGAAGQDWTPVTASVGGRTNHLFFWAVSLKDSDGDFMPDFWELANSLDPNNAADASADPDGDGYTNQDEYLLGQDPHVADPPRPTITVAATDPNAGEPNNPGVVTFTRTGATTRSLTVYYTVYGSARAGTDYQALNGEAAFAVGQSAASVAVQPVDDSSFEGVEGLTLQLLPGIHYLNEANASATVTLADDELPGLKVWAMPEEITEGGGTNGAFGFLREGDTRSPLTMYFTLTGTATNGVAYQTLPLSVTFATNEFETNLTVVPINNTNYSGPRSLVLTVLANAGYFSETNVGSATMTLLDDEVSTVQVFADDADAREGSPVRDGRFKFLRNSSVNEPLAVVFAIHGSGVPGADYDSLPSAVTIPAGSNAAYLTVHPVDDGGYELRETAIAVLRGSPQYSIGESNCATVYIDDNEPATYNWELTKATAVAHANNTYLAPAELVVRRTGSTTTDERHKIQVLSGGAIFNGYGYVWGGDVERINEESWQLPANFEVRALFANRRSEARIQVNKNTATWMPVNPATFLQIYVTNLFATSYQTIFFHGVDRLFTANFLTSQIAEGGSAVILRLSRPDLGPFGPIWTTFNLVLQVNGVAHAGIDHTLTNLTHNIPGNLDTVDIPIQAISDGLSEGWESVYVRLDPLNPDYSPDTRAGQNWTAAANIRDPGVTGTPSVLDNDEDGMADDFERAYGKNPFVFDDPYVDTDGDGMPDLEESLAGTNPNSRDSDNDGLDDYAEWIHGSSATNATENFLRPASDYAPVKLAAASCYRCHETTLQVGPSALTSARPVRGQYSGDTRREQIFQFLKGASYPIHISGPVLADAGGSYTAEVLPPTNGVPPEFFLNDPDGMLGVAQPVSNLLSKTATLIVPKLELTWTNKSGNLALDHNTNAINGEVRGKRIFVGAKTTNENNARNTLMLYIKTTPPLAGSNVWVRSFDVDDTTDDKRFDNADVIDTTGRLGEDNFNDYLNTPKPGMFVANGSSSYATTLDANGEALVEFRVGMQPGNNYRIAATVFSTSQLGGLQSGDATGGAYVSAYTDIIRSGFNGALSPLLTVWRKLHLEIDSMTGPPPSGPEANFVAGKIATIKPDQPNAGQTTVYFSFVDQLWSGNRFENGSLTIAALGSSSAIIASSAATYPHPYQWHYQPFVIVEGSVPTNAVNAVCILRDDDDRLRAELQLPGLPMDGFSSSIIEGKSQVFSTNKVRGVASVYAPAFIQVVDANQAGWNPRRAIAFFKNKDVFDNPFALSGIFDSQKDLTDSPIFWAHTVTMGYQPEFSEDRDNNDEAAVLGVTPEAPVTARAFGYSAIYDETIRDYAYEIHGPSKYVPAFYKDHEASYYNSLFGTIAHEVGHAPGNGFEDYTDHAEKSLMQKGGDQISTDFAPKSIRRFRTSTSWMDGAP